MSERLVRMKGRAKLAPFFEKTMHWRIVDAHDGLIAEGHVVVADLLDVQPWASGGLDLGRVAPSRT